MATPVAFRDPLPDAVDVVIIGGGVIGVFSALFLARRGMRVLVCEKGRIAGEQSSRNWGWIRQHGRDPAELPVMTQSLRLWHDINRETGGATGVTTAGTSYLASSAKEMAVLEGWMPIAREHGLDTRLLSRTEAQALFSGEADHTWVGGTTTPSDARGEPWAAVPAVARLARTDGVAIREDCAVRALDLAGGKVAGVVTEGGRVACDQVVLAGGAWSSLFARRHGIDVPQLSVQGTAACTAPLTEFATGNATDEKLALRRRSDGGYTLALADRNGFHPGPDALRHFLTYLPLLKPSWRAIKLHVRAPHGRPDGWRTARIWSEDRETPFERLRVLEPAPNRAYVRMMVERFAARFPGLGRPAIADCWSGLIDTMPDVVPVVDEVPAIDGLVMATGMCGHGFGIGPGFGRVVARMVAGDPPEHDLHRFRFSRFADGSRLELGPAL